MGADQPAARPECEHYWAFHCYGGISVRLCQLCHEPDWKSLRGQLAEAERKGVPVSGCPFCKRIAAGEYESWTEDPDVVWFEPLSPVTPGHMLFVPVRHVADALTDPYTTALTMECAARWVTRQPVVESCNLITSVGPEATQSVYHLHVHMVPRRAGDGLPLPWDGQHKRYEASR